MGIFTFGTFAYANKPWDRVQASHPTFTIFCFCAGMFLVWQHTSATVEFDPSPGRIAAPMDLQPSWDAISFRNPTLRWVYAHVFTLVFSCSAVILGRNLVRFRFTRGLTVFGTLADCVWPTVNDWFRRAVDRLVGAVVVGAIASLTKVCGFCCDY